LQAASATFKSRTFTRMPELTTRSAMAALAAMLWLATSAALAEDQGKIGAGERVYNTYCQPCHGEDLVSTGQIFDLRRLKPEDRPRFDNSVRNGKNQMPPWRDLLNDQQIDAIWAYIRSVVDR
jgi:mono/diheme cytochrome c family protein